MSLQPSPICSALLRQLTTAGPPVSRLLMPWVYSWAMTPASMSLSRLTGRSGLTARVADTGAAALSVAPLSRLTITDGMVMVASAPPMVMGAPATLLATMTPAAPDAWALATFTVKLHWPRSTMAMLPAGTVNGSQPSPSGATPSLTTAVMPETEVVAESCGPKAAAVAG